MQTLRESVPETTSDSASLRAVSFAGTFAALTASLLLCRVPEAHPGTLSVHALLVTACKYLFVPAIVGLGATWLYFQFSVPLPAKVFRSLIRCLCEAWLFFPAFTLLLWENSPALLALAPIAAIAVTLSLERFLPAPPEPALLASGQIFATPPPLPSRGRALFTALALVAAIAETADDDLATAGFILALVSYLLIRQWSTLTKRNDTLSPQQERSPEHPPGPVPPGPVRLGTSLILALLLTVVALLPWLSSRRLSAHMLLGPAPDVKNQSPAHADAPMLAADGWHAIALWPFPPKKDKLPPIPHTSLQAAANFTRPLVIPFNGAYRYFQTTGAWRPERAHTAHGSPLNVDIHSVGAEPLFEEAHQLLAQPIETSCCRSIEVTIRNGDNSHGGVVLGLVLRDSTQPELPPDPYNPHPAYTVNGPRSEVSELALTPQPVMTSFPTGFTIKAAPVSETLTFNIPAQPRLRRFDEISVVFLPEARRSESGAKIAVQEFQLIPR
ncbi:hypothetical protein [Silvibacterium sp.]|uniref:hypothetical protein n=1 Tax=Silvibacterium sp. TaxID=1964179 RepID=UPI0039E6AC5F